MQPAIIEEKVFKKIDYRQDRLQRGDYELCLFDSCDFSNSNLSNCRFIDCEFVNCNLSSTNINGASFQQVIFQDCKMLGLHFDKCDPFGFEITLENCQLDHSSFYKMKLTHLKASDSKFQEVDFTEADLSKVTLDNCDFAGAVFDRTNLKKTDFRTALNYSIDPESNEVKGAKFSIDGVAGLLEKYQIIIEK